MTGDVGERQVIQAVQLLLEPVELADQYVGAAVVVGYFNLEPSRVFVEAIADVEGEFIHQIGGVTGEVSGEQILHDPFGAYVGVMSLAVVVP